MNKNVYEECPIYKNELITLRKTNEEDLEELLKCYSDEKAVQLFNSDNCHGDNFYYTTPEKMRQAIEFWEYSYKNKYFVRWTVILNDTNEKIGTIEMFHRLAEDEFNHYGVLRIDLQSKYERQDIIESILTISNKFFYSDFDVKAILTKAVPIANERIKALNKMGYRSVNKKFMTYDGYYCREI
ncbi:GNAT family protein [Clostridium sp.]|uniref:GNAT family N-acetyltransferase n=1 Tax=Clostridium sp. TaxID=1506 RepID=UPI0028453B35|nr:GNAT family protein [Clostridium sp.]MDR3594054.1 GNAT family protein [Clostridium sp.]